VRIPEDVWQVCGDVRLALHLADGVLQIRHYRLPDEDYVSHRASPDLRVRGRKAPDEQWDNFVGELAKFLCGGVGVAATCFASQQLTSYDPIRASALRGPSAARAGGTTCGSQQSSHQN